jgi:predicted metal-dependent hydrolase
MMQKKHFVKYGSISIFFEVTYAKRKTLAIKVTPNAMVHVIAPIGATENDIADKVKSKAKWIIKNQLFFSQYLPHSSLKKFINGETHLYLGRQYLLSINSLINKGETGNVKLFRGKMQIFCPAEQLSQVESILENFYKVRAKEIFTNILNESIILDKRFSKYTIQLSIRKLNNRWGSCSTSGKIILNYNLIKAPKACIEYVVIHELCHLVHHNHSKEFYKLQEKLFPNWEKWKSKLEQIMS